MRLKLTIIKLKFHLYKKNKEKNVLQPAMQIFSTYFILCIKLKMNILTLPIMDEKLVTRVLSF